MADPIETAAAAVKSAAAKADAEEVVAQSWVSKQLAWAGAHPKTVTLVIVGLVALVALKLVFKVI